MTDAQPFAHLAAPNARLYRDVLTVFARARDRFIVHLRPEDVATDLGRPGDTEQVGAAVEQLVAWGNLRSDPDTGRVTTVADFHRARYLYQLTGAGQAAEEAIAVYEEAIGRRGSLQSVALADIAVQLRALVEVARGEDLDPAKVHLLLLALADRFTGLADNAQAFMASLRRVIDFADGDVAAFVAYKQRLIGYVERFIADLADRGAEIAGLLARIEADDVERLLAVAARREAEDAVPDEDGYADVLAAAVAGWRNRWRGLRDWFLSADARHPSQARLLRGAALNAITQLIDTVSALNERRSGRSDRAADFRALARWFAKTPDDAAAHRLWRVAFGLTSTRHLTVTAATLDAWEADQPTPQTPWADAPAVRISPQLRKTGAYERRGRQSQITDRHAHRQLLLAHAEREADEVAEARRRLATDGPVLLSDLGVLEARTFRLFLGLLGDALSARSPDDTEVKTTTGDGSMEIRLSLVADGGEVAIDTEDGVLRGPEHVIDIIDLMRGTA
ncbi:TIGR02677 family protein [Alloactinosynnema sp. L-07]|uniref:TIGR02677 family protein n=1 Tax=Alloactinosynnema sp. L-07 TaxID=1653480 RepID=UPI0006B4CB5E|nr:TIGR02677 family protein [Alloactinosynnema sp. L-07]